jgi:hypothetical protein
MEPEEIAILLLTVVVLAVLVPIAIVLWRTVV